MFFYTQILVEAGEKEFSEQFLGKERYYRLLLPTITVIVVAINLIWNNCSPCKNRQIKSETSLSLNTSKRAITYCSCMMTSIMDLQHHCNPSKMHQQPQTIIRVSFFIFQNLVYFNDFMSFSTIKSLLALVLYEIDSTLPGLPSVIPHMTA